MQDDNTHPTPDDALEPADDLFRPDKDEERLPGDYSTPAAPADDTGSTPLPPDYPQTDVRPDAHEVYDEGEADATIDNRTERPKNGPWPVGS